MKTNPEISLNKLAEFPGASVAKKNAILKSFKINDVVAASKHNRYATAKSAILCFLSDPEHDYKIFETKSNQLRNKKADTKHKKDDIQNSLLAISKLERLAQDELRSILPFKVERGLPKEQKSLMINGILIRIGPDIIIMKNGIIIGAIKLCFAKSKPLTPLEGQIIAGLTQKHLHKISKTKIEPRYCFALDVFALRKHVAPESFTYHNTLLKKAYTEINQLWPTIK